MRKIFSQNFEGTCFLCISFNLIIKINDMKSLKQTRINKDIRRSDIANFLGINLSNISPIESGKQVPSRLTRERLELFFSDKINWLDTPKLKSTPTSPTDWFSCEREFRSLYRMILGLEPSERTIFCSTISKHLRKLKSAAEIS